MDKNLLQRLERHIEIQNSAEYHDIRSQRLSSRLIETINNNLKERPRAVVSLGCSFAQGQAAYDDEILNFLRPMGGGSCSDFNYAYKNHDLKDLLDFAEYFKLSIIPKSQDNEQWYNQSPGNYEVVTGEIEIANSFVNKFAELSDYVPINLGNLGNGNTSSINRLFTYPIDWHLCDEVLILWCYTDLNRFDLVNDTGLDYHQIGNDHKTMWPQADFYDPSREKFHQGINWHNTQYYWTRTAWSEVYNYINFVTAGIKLNTWCKSHDAKLITFGAFNKINRKIVEHEYCYGNITRDKTHEIIENFDNPKHQTMIDYNVRSLDLFPWHTMYEPGEEETFFDLALAQDLKHEDFSEYCKNKIGKTENINMWDVINMSGTPRDWIFACGHPSAKAHDLLAQNLFKHYQEVYL